MTAAQIADIGAYVQFERKLHEQQGSGVGLALARRLAEASSLSAVNKSALATKAAQLPQ